MPVTHLPPYLRHEIDYTRTLAKELVTQHKQTWQRKGKTLVSAILYGPLAANEYDENINLLEIVKGYPKNGGASAYEFQSTLQFPMYGRLRLKIISPEEFKKEVKTNSSLVADISDQKRFLYDQGDFAKKLLK